MIEDGALPPIGNSLGKSNTGRRGTLHPPPSYYDGPAYSFKGSKPGGVSNVPVKRQSGAVKYGNKVVQGGSVLGSGVQATLSTQTSIKYNKAKGSSNATMGAVGTGAKQGAGGSKYLSPYSLRNLAGQEQVTYWEGCWMWKEISVLGIFLQDDDSMKIWYRPMRWIYLGTHGFRMQFN